MSEEFTDTEPASKPVIPKEIIRCRLPRTTYKDYNVIRFSNRGKASIDGYELFRYLEDHWFVYEGGTPYRFNGCVYAQTTDVEVETIMYRLVDQSLAGFNGDKPILKETMVKDMIKMYSRTHTVNDLPEPPEGASSLMAYESDLGLVAFLNGILNMSTFEFLPFTPYVFVSFQVQAMYDPDLKEHPVEEIYKGILPDDETRAVFYRLAGYTMYSDILRIPGIFMFYGGGETGKTSLQKAMMRLMSPYSYSSLTMLDLADKFAPSALEGKRANFCGEADDRSSKETKISGGMLKDISEDGKEFWVQKKFHQSYPIRPTAKLWFCSNVMPDFGDRTSGLYRRLYIIPCRIKQSWDAQIQDAMQEPEALSWLANKCLEGYLDFLADGCKVIPSADMKVELTQYMLQDNLMEFLMTEFGQISDKAKVAEQLDGMIASDFYAKYEAFCRIQGSTALRATRFHERIRNEYNLGSESKTVRLPGAEGTTSRAIYRIRG